MDSDSHVDNSINNRLGQLIYNRPKMIISVDLANTCTCFHNIRWMYHITGIASKCEITPKCNLLGSSGFIIALTRFAALMKLLTLGQLISKTCLYNIDPLKPHFYIVKLRFTGVYIIFLISAQKHRLWVLVRSASPRQF